MKKSIMAIILCTITIFSLSGCGNDGLQEQVDKLNADYQQLEVELEEQKKQNQLINSDIEQLENVLKDQKELNASINETVNLREGLYKLRDAFILGMISYDDLMSIAYYHNGGIKYNEEIIPDAFNPKPKTPEKLDEETELKINEYIAKDYKSGYICGEIYDYYGTYNNYTVVYIMNYDLGDGWMEEIGGLEFKQTALTNIAVLFEKNFK